MAFEGVAGGGWDVAAGAACWRLQRCGVGGAGVRREGVCAGWREESVKVGGDGVVDGGAGEAEEICVGSGCQYVSSI